MKPETLARKMVGDGKRPNKFFVCISGGWLEETEPHNFEAYSEIHPEYKYPKTLTFGPFDSYQEAQDCIETESWRIGEPGESEYNTVSIEDRLTGVVYEGTYYARKRKVGPYETIKLTWETIDDSKMIPE